MRVVYYVVSANSMRVSELPMPTMTANEMIDAFVKLRDRKDDIEKRHKIELAPINDMMKTLEAYLLESMRAGKLTSVRGSSGTAYKVLRTSARVSDWLAVMAYIREHDAWDLLEHRVSKLAVQAIIEETQAPIPGVETSQEEGVNVRRATANSRQSSRSTEEVE